MMTEPAQKKQGFLRSLKPRCLLNMEQALEKLNDVTDKTDELVRDNGVRLQEAHKDYKKA